MEHAPSAAARVFAIPELLDGIFYWATMLQGPDWDAQRRKAADLLRVNSLFHSCAARHIWSKCGSDLGPSLYDLAKMASKPQRLQWYASFIEGITISDGRERTESRQVEPGVWAAFDRLVPNLEFPRLWNVTLTAQQGKETVDALAQLLPYMRHAKELEISGSRLSAALWIAMKALAVKLEVLSIALDLQVKDEPDGPVAFREMLTSAAGLRGLALTGPMTKLWSLETFLALARCDVPDSLHLDLNAGFYVPPEWIAHIRRSVPAPFRCLRMFQWFHTTADGLNLLMPCITGAIDLSIFLATGMEALNFQSLRQLPELKSLNLHCGKVGMQDILQVIEHCTSLVSFVISADLVDYADLSPRDVVICAIARKFPNLAVLGLDTSSGPFPERSLIELGQRCKSLRELTLISTGLDCKRLATCMGENMFPALESFVLLQSETPQRIDFSFASENEFTTVVMRIAKAIPNCTTIALEDVYATIAGRRTVAVDKEVFEMLRRIRFYR